MCSCWGHSRKSGDPDGLEGVSACTCAHCHTSGDSKLACHGSHATGECPLLAHRKRCLSSSLGRQVARKRKSFFPSHRSTIYLSFSVASRAADSPLIFSVCWGVHGAGVSKGCLASQQALNVSVYYSPTGSYLFHDGNVMSAVFTGQLGNLMFFTFLSLAGLTSAGCPST